MSVFSPAPERFHSLTLVATSVSEWSFSGAEFPPYALVRERLP